MKNLLILVALVSMLQLCAFGQTAVSGNVTLTANASDVTTATGDLECGVAFVQFYNGTTPIGPQITAPTSGSSYVFVWDTKTVANGNYSISAKASDKAGGVDAAGNGICNSTKPNVGTSAAMVVAVSNIPADVAVPTISITIN